MKNLMLTAFLLLSSFAMLSANGMVDVKIHLKDGSIVEGAAYINDNEPWNHQEAIKVIPRELRDVEEITEDDITTYFAKKILGYEREGRFFKSMKVMLTPREEYGNDLSMLPIHTFCERIQDGAIKVYSAYSYPAFKIPAELEDHVYEDHRKNPNYFVKHFNMKKRKSLTIVGIEKITKDCPEVVQKMKDGAYGNIKKKKKRGLRNLVAKAAMGSDVAMKLAIIADYNSIMTAEASK